MPKSEEYQLLTGRRLSLISLTGSEWCFFKKVQKKYFSSPEWTEFSSWWRKNFDDIGWKESTLLFRICQDFEARLGVVQGKVAYPDYRDQLADLIDERFGSRYKFCKQLGIDQGQLSRILASKADFSIAALQKILDSLDAILVIQKKPT